MKALHAQSLTQVHGGDYYFTAQFPVLTKKGAQLLVKTLSTGYLLKCAWSALSKGNLPGKEDLTGAVLVVGAEMVGNDLIEHLYDSYNLPTGKN